MGNGVGGDAMGTKLQGAQSGLGWSHDPRIYGCCWCEDGEFYLRELGSVKVGDASSASRFSAHIVRL